MSCSYVAVQSFLGCSWEIEAFEETHTESNAVNIAKMIHEALETRKQTFRKLLRM